MKRILFSLMLLCAVSGVCLAQHGWHAIDAITLNQCPTEYGGMTAYLHEILCLSHDDIQLLRKRFLQ